MVSKVYLLRTGFLILDKSMFTRTDNGIKQKCPVYCVLLQTDDGRNILVDTGQNPHGIKEPDKTWGTRHLELPPVMEEPDDIRNRLKQIGLEPKDIDTVINTHLHWDHTGGNQFFTNANFYVQKAEYRFALYPDSFFGKSFLYNHFNVGVHYELMEGDFELTEGVFVFDTCGHTPGHQSVLVTMTDGRKLIVTGDACYIPENVNNLVLQGNCYDNCAAVRSLNKLRTIRTIIGADLLPSHNPSPDFFDTLPDYIQVVG